MQNHLNWILHLTSDISLHCICDFILGKYFIAAFNKLFSDETAINCERFINEDGMEVFMQCLKVRSNCFFYVKECIF